MSDGTATSVRKRFGVGGILWLLLGLWFAGFSLQEAIARQGAEPAGLGGVAILALATFTVWRTGTGVPPRLVLLVPALLAASLAVYLMETGLVSGPARIAFAWAFAVSTVWLLGPTREELVATRFGRLFVMWRVRFGFPLALVGVAGIALAVSSVSRSVFDAFRGPPLPSLSALLDPRNVERGIKNLLSGIVNAGTQLPIGDHERIPTVQLVIDPERLAVFAPRSARRGTVSVNGTVRLGDRWTEVKVGLRGDNVYHWGAEQKSYRVEFRKPDQVRGQRVLNLVNPKDLEGTSLLFGEEIGRQLGLLVPGTYPCRFILNGRNEGVYLCQSATDESWLRRSGRVPGNVYVGDQPPWNDGWEDFDPAQSIWMQPKAWTSVATVPLLGDQAPEIKEMISIVQEVLTLPANAEEGRVVAARERLEKIIDVEKFLRLSLVQAWTNSRHQSEVHNWRVYWDPSRGKIEPTVWDTMKWPKVVDGVDPLYAPLPRIQLALLRFGDLEQRRLRILWEELAAPERAESRSARWLQWHHDRVDGVRKSASSFDEADFSTWDDERNNWVAATRFDVQVAHDELVEEMRGHHERLARAVEKIDVREASCIAGGEQLKCRFRSSAHAGLRLVGVRTAGCEVGIAPGEFCYAAGSRDDAEVDFPSRLLLDGDPSKVFGLVVRPVDTVHAFAVDASACRLEAGELAFAFENAATARRRWVSFELASDEAENAAEQAQWQFKRLRKPTLQERVLGPGEVLLDRTLVIAAHERLVVKPGTKVLLASDVSIISDGPVAIEGTEGQPIEFRPAKDGARWGGLLVKGPATRGSVMRWVRVRGGSIVREPFLNVTGMVSFHLSDGLVLDDVILEDNVTSDDTLHVIHANGVLMRRIEVSNGNSDCIDLDYVTAEIEDLRALGCRNDGLDLMTSRLNLNRATLAGCGDKGMSIGEDSRATLTGVAFEGDEIGVQVKDLSRVLLGRGVRFAGNRLDLSAYRKSAYYGLGGCIVSTVAQESIGTSIENESMFVSLAPGDGTAEWERRCWPGR